ncbi:MAG: FAD-binding protein [Eubacteriales bacterium]|nr:FAD-binding protein [Eubacteriales bacterium]
MKIYTCNTAVVGAGAAGLNAADELMKRGVDTILIAPGLAAGTSRNAGSDKQTFFKLNVAGDYNDSPASLARAFFAGGAMHGDTAYALAAGSPRAFFKLVELGVPFPQNELGEFVGYRTDHDESLRATSAGPLTSRFMAEKLLGSVQARGTKILEGYALAAVLTDEAGALCGLLIVNEEETAVVAARNAILATGGPATVYSRSVFPTSQTGATGAAVRAGAQTNNLCYWQYGLASRKVLWNVSGSYQQAIPAYRDEQGRRVLDESDFDGEGDLLDSIFRKGYQWPFDARKLGGSSRVDRQVLRLMAKGGRAFLDFRQEETDAPLEKIGPEAAEYLKNCGADQSTPYERLLAINPAAAAFYRDRGIDLEQEPLEIAVCAQHCNGGIKVDKWWRTSVPGLYAAGECAGAFGMYRPGGSALNETQVGSLRAVQHIAAHSGTQPAPQAEGFRAANLEGELAFLEAARQGRAGALVAFAQQARQRMDVVAGALRDGEGMRLLSAQVEQALAAPLQGEGGYTLAQAVAARDDLFVMREALAAMLCQMQLAGEAGHGFTQREIAPDAPKAELYCVETHGAQASLVPVRPVPQGGGWFETVWKAYLDGSVFAGEEERAE